MNELAKDDRLGPSVDKPVAINELASSLTILLESDAAPEAVLQFSKLQAPDQADIVARISTDVRDNLLRWLTPQSLGIIISRLAPFLAIEVSLRLGPSRLSRVLDETSPHVAAHILRNLPEDTKRSVLSRLSESKDVAPLLEYRHDEAGGLMTPEFIAIDEEMTIEQSMAFVRRGGRKLHPNDISQLFVTNRQGILVGTVDLARLVLALPSQRISLLIQPDSIFSVPVLTDQEQCGRLMERYNLRRLAVVDNDGKLLGVLKLENMINVLEDEATEDMFRIIGVGKGEKALGPFWNAIKNRLPWLFVNLGTAILAGLCIALFESTLNRAVALAVFLPVIAGQGGIAGTQTLILIVRSIALGEIEPRSAKKLLVKELALGLVHGAALGLTIGIITFLWQGSGYLALIVGVSMLSNLAIAGISGVIVPLSLRAFGIDPALASAVAVTTITDVLGFLIYLGLASISIELITQTL